MDFFQHSIVQLIELAAGCIADICQNTALLRIERHAPLDAPFLDLDLDSRL